MEQLNLNLLLNRIESEKIFIDALNSFEQNKQNKTIKRGIYVYGSPGSGKSYFVKQLLKTPLMLLHIRGIKLIH